MELKEKFKSSPFHFNDFLESSVWHDMLLMIEDMREDIRNNLETVKELEELYRFQGRADVCLVMQSIPEQILNLMEEDKEVEELPDQPDEFDLD